MSQLGLFGDTPPPQPAPTPAQRAKKRAPQTQAAPAAVKTKPLSGEDPLPWESEVAQPKPPQPKPPQPEAAQPDATAEAAPNASASADKPAQATRAAPAHEAAEPMDPVSARETPATPEKVSEGAETPADRPRTTQASDAALADVANDPTLASLAPEAPLPDAWVALADQATREASALLAHVDERADLDTRTRQRGAVRDRTPPVDDETAAAFELIATFSAAPGAAKAALDRILAELIALDAFAQGQLRRAENHAQKTKSWSDLSCLVLDTETSGLDSSTHRIIEIAWVRYDGGRETARHAQLLRIDEPLSREVQELTGIRDDMLAGEPDFATFAPTLLAAAADVDYIAAYNAPFDRGFIHAELARAGYGPLPHKWVDPLVFIKQIDKYQRGKRLTDAARRWGVSLDGAHRALADAQATGELLRRLVPELPGGPLDALLAVQTEWADAQERDFQRYIARKKRLFTPRDEGPTLFSGKDG